MKKKKKKKKKKKFGPPIGGERQATAYKCCGKNGKVWSCGQYDSWQLPTYVVS